MSFSFFLGLDCNFIDLCLVKKVFLQFHLPKLEKSVVTKKVHEGVKGIM